MATTSQALPPSIVVVFTDDQRYDSMGCTGHPFIKTPHLDRMAAEGALFEQAFVITSLCSPSRATVLTGLYTHLSGVSTNDQNIDHGKITVVPELLRKAGYATAFIGKYHLGVPDAAPQPGFDYWAAFQLQGRYHDARVNLNGTPTDLPGFSTDRLTDLALDWIGGLGGRPFFLMLSVKNTHIPSHPPRRHQHLYGNTPIELPESFGDSPTTLPRFLLRWAAGGLLVETGTDLPSRMRDKVRRYSRLMPSLDDAIGRLRAGLDEAGTLDETAMILFSDNGFMLGEHGLIGKMLPFEESIHVPFLIRYPPLARPGTRMGQPVLNLDLAPTLLDLAGLEQPETMRGASIVPLLRGAGGGSQATAADDWRHDWLFIGNFKEAETGPTFLAVRSNAWKYVRIRRGKIFDLLFDLQADPQERVNLAADPGYEDRLDAMRARMKELMIAEKAPLHWLTTRLSGQEADPAADD